MKRLFVGVYVLLSLSVCQSSALGVIGESFPIAEMSFLRFIEERVHTLTQNGGLDALEKRWTMDAARHANRPQPLTLKRALIKRTYLYVPEVVLSHDLTDHLGRVIYPAGTHANALEQMPAYRPCWLFFNGDDEAQVRWALKTLRTCANHKLILTGGALKDAEGRFQDVIYFDQEARITKKLGISEVPALVVREGQALRVSENVIKENGDVV